MAAAQRLYARALFEAAREQNRVDDVVTELGDFAEAVRTVPELRSLLENPQLDPAAKRAALADLLADADPLVRHFMVWPGLAILVTTLAFNLLGDGLRDAFDPRRVSN